MNDRVIPANGDIHIKSVFQKNDLPEDANAGLVFNKFLNIWEGSSIDPSKNNETGKALSGFVTAYNRRNQKTSAPCRLLSEINQRMKRYEKKCHMQKLTFKVSWRLSCGIGISNPIGNGFDFDPVIGVPIINGTAIKGLCRHTAKIFSFDETELTRLFGSETIEPGQTDPSTGYILFLDALPVRWPTLDVDIINCHHGDYYTQMEKHNQKNEPNWPKETDSPNPVFFLSVAHDTEFEFRISSRSSNLNDKKAEQDLKTVLGFLRQGLEYFGIGAKTAVGYGVFDVTE